MNRHLMKCDHGPAKTKRPCLRAGIQNLRMFAVAMLIGLVCGGILRADGKVFPAQAEPAEIRMPDQRALLSWSNGIERLVIETRFAGAGTNFAWVVPLPAVPVVEASTAGLFPTLVHLTRPKVVHAVPNWWLAGSFFAGAFWLWLTLKSDGPLRLEDWLAAAAMGIGIGGIESGSLFLIGIITFGAALYGAYRKRRSGRPFGEILLLVLLFGILAGMLLPALSTAGARSVYGSVNVLDRQVAGVYETTTISGKDPSAVRRWLNDNGYAMPAETEPVVAEYLREGWVFVATRIRRDISKPEVESIHPLRFTFPTEKPVYPLRLTGVGNDRLDVDLYVVGSMRARASDFSVRSCRLTTYRSRLLQSSAYPAQEGALPMAHPELQLSAASGEVMTHLEGHLDAAAMRRDAVIEWEPFRELQFIRYSSRGAFATVFNWTGNAFALLLIAVAAIARVHGIEWTEFRRVVVVGAIFTVAATIAGYAILPVIPVKTESRIKRRVEIGSQQGLIRERVKEMQANKATVSVDTVRKALRERLISRPFTTSFREEDSPNNYWVRSGSNAVEVLLFDDFGAYETIRIPSN